MLPRLVLYEPRHAISFFDPTILLLYLYIRLLYTYLTIQFNIFPFTRNSKFPP
jgi:hypothetical protein